MAAGVSLEGWFSFFCVGTDVDDLGDEIKPEGRSKTAGHEDEKEGAAGRFIAEAFGDSKDQKKDAEGGAEGGDEGEPICLAADGFAAGINSHLRWYFYGRR